MERHKMNTRPARVVAIARSVFGAGLLAWLLATESAQAQSNRVIVYSKPDEPVASFAVYVPEKLDTMQEQYSTSESGQRIVQGVIESALMHSGYKLVNLALAAAGPPTSPKDALFKARALDVDYLVLGQATASQINASGADPAIGLGLNKLSSSAELSVQVIVVRDGSVLLAETESSTGSARSDRSAGQGALREAADQLAAKLMSSIRRRLDN